VQRLRQGSLAYRLWSSVAVKCGHYEKGCCWSGSIVDVKNHNCQFGGVRQVADPAELARLREEKEALVRERSVLNAFLDEKNQENEALQRNLSVVKEKLAKHTMFDSSYSYNRHNVVQLSQLIARNLENKPAQVDANRIFDCVRSCYIDLQQGWNDNPEHYFIDMRMLLATCGASNWFTNRQSHNIQKWLREKEWSG
jgi:hypothetical protein